MASRTYRGKKPENMKKTVGFFLSYMGKHKRMLFVSWQLWYLSVPFVIFLELI